MDVESTPTTILHGPRLFIARAMWIVIVVLTLTLVVVGLRYSVNDILYNWRPLTRGALLLGIPSRSYAEYLVILKYTAALAFFVTAAVIFRRKSNDWMAIFVSLTLVTLAAAWYLLYIGSFAQAWEWLEAFVDFFGIICFGILFLLFPDGRFVPRWAWLLAVVWPIAILGMWSWSPGWLLVPMVLILVFAQVYRYVRVSDPVRRQQTKWVVFGLAIQIAWLLWSIPSESSAWRSPLSAFVAVHGDVLVPLLLPLTIAFSILRYRLWDIDVIINRTLVYGALTAIIVGMYVLGVGLLGTLLQTQNNLAVSLLALVAVAALIQPVRRRLQRGVDRLMPIQRVEQDAPSPQPSSRRGKGVRLPSPFGRGAGGEGEISTTTLRGPWLAIARGVWFALAVLALVAVVVNVPVMFDWLRTVCTGADCYVQLRLADVHTLQQLGLSLDLYAAYMLALFLAFMFVSGAVAVLIFWRKPDDWMALFVSLTLVIVGFAQFNSEEAVAPLWRVPVLFLGFLGFVAFVILCFLFPDGRFVPRWTGAVAALWSSFMLAGFLIFWFQGMAPDWWWNVALILIIAVYSVGGFAQVYRYRRVSNPVQRQQTKWVVAGLTVVAFWFGGFSLYLNFIRPALGQPWPSGVLYELVSTTMRAFVTLLIPVSLGIAILRYRLWNIDIIIRRTLVYGALVGIVVGLYVLIVGSLGALFQAGGNLVLSILATGLIAILFQPLRQRLQRGVNRLMYGERDDPVTVLSRLGQRLESAIAPDAVLSTIVETVAQALKLPYAAIALKHGDEFKIDAEYSLTPLPGFATPPPSPDAFRQERGEGPGEGGEVLPLIYQSETVGQLILAPRAPGEDFSPADRRLLENIARQAGAAVHAVRLTADLQHSRERLVAAREEERRRLRRDLHDGLGPTLAGQTLKIDAALDLLIGDAETGAAPNPAAARALLLELKAQTQATVADIRRLVYELRPPALDELGLVDALREHVARVAGAANGLRISVEAPPQGLPPLSAAVEVAAYRITLEAVTNVVRHARARSCIARFSLTHAGNREAQSAPLLELEIIDDGSGLPRDMRPGVGLTSMRERAAELGGRCVIERASNGGTRVLARLPLSRET